MSRKRIIFLSKTLRNPCNAWGTGKGGRKNQARTIILIHAVRMQKELFIRLHSANLFLNTFTEL